MFLDTSDSFSNQGAYKYHRTSTSNRRITKMSFELVVVPNVKKKGPNNQHVSRVVPNLLIPLISSGLGRLNFGKVARNRKCLQYLETKSTLYRDELCVVSIHSRAIRVCISIGMACCATGADPNTIGQAMKFKLQ